MCALQIQRNMLKMLIALAVLMISGVATSIVAVAIEAPSPPDANPLAPTALSFVQAKENTKNTSTVAAAILTPNEFELFANCLSFIKENKCRQDLNVTLWSIMAGEQWAITMYDATVKSAVGIASGMLHQFGHYDECLDQRLQPHLAPESLSMPVRAKYCLADVTLPYLTGQSSGSRSQKPLNGTVAHWGVCVPASCGASDVAIYLEHLLQRDVVMVADAMCQLQEQQLHISASMFFYAAVILFFILLAILSTGYHIYLLWLAKRNEGITKSALNNELLCIALLSFSIIENTKKLFQASNDQLSLNAINGIKALAMWFILAGHALLFIYGGPLYNMEFFSELAKVPTFAFLSNSLLFVDLFLLLSGFLFCRILLIELERRRGRLNVLILYVGRYIRLTPAYMVVIGFYMTWFPSVANGPIWKQRIEREQDRCLNSWWLNILYINNYVNTDKICMFQSWYLSVDSQLFFVAAIAIFMLYKFRKYALHFLITLVAGSAAIPFIVTYVRKLDPTLIIYADEINDLATNPFYVGSYIKTHMRASAYFVGLLTGYLVHIMQEKGMKLPRLFVSLSWLLSIAVGVVAMFSVTRFYNAPYTNLESSLYAGFHKLAWSLSVAWLVLAVTTGHASWLQRILSSRVFAPISRLTYCAYLSNGIVEMYHSSQLRNPPHMNYISAVNKVSGHILNTFLLAFVLCLVFESPIHALERILLRKNARHESTIRHLQQSKTNPAQSPTPSTSEEQIA